MQCEIRVPLVEIESEPETVRFSELLICIFICYLFRPPYVMRSCGTLLFLVS